MSNFLWDAKRNQSHGQNSFIQFEFLNGYRISSPDLELIGHFRVPILRASSPFGDIVKSRRASGTREETRKRRAGASSRLWRSPARSRAACFARPNRRACSQTTESQKPSFSKWGQEHNLSCENEFNWPKNEKSFPWKAEHLSSFWYRGPVELANGLFKTPFMELLACLSCLQSSRWELSGRGGKGVFS